MASEPDDYQTISDNCPGYMVLVSEGIICTRCAGEKRHKPNDCPKHATAVELATDNVPGTDPDGTDDMDSGMESLSDTESLSSESTARSDSSEMRVTDAHQFDQGGNHPQDTRLPRRGFARPDANHTSTQPDRASPSPMNNRAAHKSKQVHRIFSRFDGQTTDTAAHPSKTHTHHNRDAMYGPNSPASAEAHSLHRSGTTHSAELASNTRHYSMKTGSNKTRKRSRSDDEPTEQAIAYEASEHRLPSKSLADTTGKFEYSNTTCPSSFGFGRLPSEAMG